MKDVLQEYRSKFVEGGEIYTIPSNEYFSDSDNFPNEKAFFDFVSKLSVDDKLYLYCINIDITEINKNNGLKVGDAYLKKFYAQVSSMTPIFRIQGTKFNIIVDEEHKKLDKEFAKSNLANVYGKVYTEQYLTKGNVFELQKKGVQLMYEDRAERLGIPLPDLKATQKEEPKVKEEKEKSIESENYIIPFEEEFSNERPEEFEKETAYFKSEDALWYAEVNLHETAPKVRDLKAYVFPVVFKPDMQLVDCVVVYDDLVEARVYTNAENECPEIPIDGMKLSFSAKFNSSNRLNVAVHQDIRSIMDNIGTIDYDIEIHEGKYIPQIFGKRIGKNLMFPVKKNSKGLCEYVLYGMKDKSVQYYASGVYEGKNKFEVLRDFKGLHFVEIKVK